MGATLVGRMARSLLYYKAFTTARARLGSSPPRPRTSGAWRGNHRPGPPGAALAPYRGPRPGGGGGSGGSRSWSPRSETVTATASVVRDEPPAAGTTPPASGGPRPARPHGPAPLTPLGPVRRPLALPPGRSRRLDRLAKERAENPPPMRSKQYGLFPPIAPTAPPTPRSAEPKAVAPGSGLKHEPTFENPAPRKRTTKPKPAPSPLAPVFIAPSDHKPPRARRKPATPTEGREPRSHGR